ncbi:TPA: phage tail sheath C-terminal domain-containing protein, partial [Yersinia enterocolitica]
GQAIVTPKVIRGELLSVYRQLERAGIVENFELFKQYLIVERNADNPNRLDVLFPPDYVNQLRVFAVLNQFRLQYSEEVA